MPESNLQIEFLRELVINSPNDSELNINGFYSEHISDESFRKLFSVQQVTDKHRISMFVIPLTPVLQEILINILELEREKLIFDMVHFTVVKENRPIFVSYDGMDFMQISKSGFNSEFCQTIPAKYKELEIEICNEIIDNGFFSTKKKPAHNSAYSLWRDYRKFEF